jgi:hypothetical protein
MKGQIFFHLTFKRQCRVLFLSSSDIDESPSQHSSQSCKVVAKETQTGVTKENYHETLNDGISQSEIR